MFVIKFSVSNIRVLIYCIKIYLRNKLNVITFVKPYIHIG